MAESGIALVITSMDGGGAERVCCHLANHWAGKGRQVLLVVLRRGGVFEQQLDPRVRVESLEKPRARQALRPLVTLLAATPREMPVLAFGFEFGVVLGFLKMLRLIANPVVYREGNNPRVFISARRRWLYAAAIGWSDRCVAQVACVRRELADLGIDPAATAVIANPVALQSAGRARHAAPAGAGPVLASVGRLAPQKGFDRLLDAMAALVKSTPSARLLVAGTGPEQANLAAQAQRLRLGASVDFVGFVDQPDRLLTHADLFVLASHYEGQPNALLEALAAGSRVLAAGGAPVEELLGLLGLEESFLTAEDFGPAFPAKVRAVLKVSEERWADARRRLRALTDPDRVASHYWDFCQEPVRPSI